MIHRRRQWLGTALLAFSSFLATIFQIGLSPFLVYPLNKINLIALFIIIVLLITESGRVVWLSFVAYSLLELFSLAPFGVALYAGVISALISFWLYKTIFTNRTILTTVALTAIFIFSYRSLYSMILYTVSPWRDNGEAIFALPLASYGYELIATALAAAVAHFSLKFFIPELNTAKLKNKL